MAYIDNQHPNINFDEISTDILEKSGILKEANRQFFHTIGLHVYSENDQIKAVIVPEYDEEGFNYKCPPSDVIADRIKDIQENYSKYRQYRYNNLVQPTTVCSDHWFYLAKSRVLHELNTQYDELWLSALPVNNFPGIPIDSAHLALSIYNFDSMTEKIVSRIWIPKDLSQSLYTENNIECINGTKDYDFEFIYIKTKREQIHESDS
jgi:hypothetical protein